MRVQDRRGGQDDEVHDDVGEEHPDQDVDPRLLQLRHLNTAPIGFGALARLAHLIDFGRRLPEEEVGRDGGAEHRHQRHDEILVPGQLRDQAGAQNRHHIGVHQDAGEHVGEQRQREPFEDLEDGRIAHEELQADDQDGDRDDQPELGDDIATEQRTARGHRSQVGADVDGVGAKQRQDARADQHGREFAAQCDAEADAGVQGDARAQLLHRSHQRKGEKRSP